MLSENDFQQWCDRLQISDAAKKEIQLIRSSEPSRRVGGGKRNVSGRYSSQKMGVTIQFESHKVELPFIYQLEHDDDVLEYYDQPPSFKLSYQSSSGKNLGFYYTSDFFVIRNDSAHKRTISRHFPKLCHQISAKYTQQMKSQHKKTIEQTCQEVRQAVSKLHDEGKYPSQNKVEKLISRPGLLRYKEVKKAFAKAKQELNFR